MKGIKLVAAFVAVLLALAAASVALAAQDESEGQGTASPAGETEGLPGRTADSETLAIPDGRLETRIYPDPINYRDEEGNWRPIGETLHETGEQTVVNGSNDFDVTLPKQIDAKPVRFEVGDQWVESQLLRKDLEGAELEGGTATYEGEGNAPSFEFTGLSDGLKEEIELSGPGQASTYTYELTASDGLEPSLAEGGSIQFRDTEGKTVVLLPAPVMSDSAGAESRAVHYELGPEEEGHWKLSVVADPEWLQRPDRKFPAVIDPTIVQGLALNCVIGGHKGETGWIDCASWGRKDLLVGYSPKVKSAEDNWWRSLMEVETTAVPANSEISSATFNIHSLEVAKNTKGVELRKTTKPWTWQASWSRYDGPEHLWTTEGGDYSESLGEVLTANRGTGIGWWQFNVPTNVVESEVNAGEWLMVIMKLIDDKVRECGAEACTERKVDFDSSAATTEANRPYLSVVYKAPAPIVTTEAATSITETGATLKGQVNPHGYATTYQFEYGTTTSYGTKVPTTAESVGSGKTNVAVSKAISGLKLGTTYHYRVSATNAYGTTPGLDKTFTTSKLPTATTEAASGVKEKEATLKGSVNPNGSATTYQFEYGTTTSYGTKVPLSPESVGSGTTAVAVSKAISGLTEGSTYHYRLMATNSVGTAYGKDYSFTTQSPPTVVTGPSANTNTVAGTLLGSVNPNRLESTFYFEYGPTTAYGSKTPSLEAHLGSGENPIAVSGPISNLKPNTVYHYRVVATNLVGTAYGNDKSIIVDQIKPNMTFASTYSAANPNQYGLEIQASDLGAVQSGLRSITILLNGVTEKTETFACPAAQCPASGALTWTKSFEHPLDGSDRLTVLAVDDAGNATSTSFDLPSKVVHATVYTANPASGGAKVAEEWAELGTHNSRRTTSADLVTRGSGGCQTESTTSRCSFLRSLNTNTENGEPQKYYSEVSTEMSEPNAISEAGTLLLPRQADFGQSGEKGAMSTVLQSWQTPPPGSGGSFEKIVSTSKASEEDLLPGEWIFWVDSSTGLPVKAATKEGSQAPQTMYYSYDSTVQEAGTLSPEFFLQQPPTPESEGCKASGTIGGWSFNKLGMVYPEPTFNSLVVGDHGLVTLHPEGAAIDGYENRSELTNVGVTLSTNPADVGPITWEVTESPSQILEQTGENFVIETEAGSPSAVITSSTPDRMSVVNGAAEKVGQSGDKIVLEGEGEAVASVQPLKNEPVGQKTLCITQGQIEHAVGVQEEAQKARNEAMGAKASGGTKTTSVVVYINPHPALSGVSVTDKYGACNSPHAKTFGSDGRVEFGGCPVGKDVTLTVPSSVNSGGTTYNVPDSSRTFQPPAAGWTVQFNYDAQAAPPPPPGEKPTWFTPLPNMTIVENTEEAGASSEQPIPIPPGIGCVGVASHPFKSDTHFAQLFTAEARFSMRCRAEAAVVSWSAHQSLYRYNKNTSPNWIIRQNKEPKGVGPAITNQGPYVISAECRGLDELLSEPVKLWKHVVSFTTISDDPPGTEASGNEAKAKIHCG